MGNVFYEFHGMVVFLLFSFTSIVGIAFGVYLQRTDERMVDAVGSFIAMWILVLSLAFSWVTINVVSKSVLGENVSISTLPNADE